jgi:flagellar protein FlbD
VWPARCSGDDGSQEWEPASVIVFTRLNRNPIALNPDRIQRVEATPDTVVTMTDDKKVLVLESMDEVVRLITDYRAYVIARSATIEVVDVPRPTLHLVPTDVVVMHDDLEPETEARIADYVARLAAEGEAD